MRFPIFAPVWVGYRTGFFLYLKFSFSISAFLQTPFMRFGLVILFLIVANSLFGQQASNVQFNWIANNQLQITWTKGSATSLVVLYPNQGALQPPSFGGIYTASSTYGNGSALGNGYVVYDGSGTSVIVTGIVRCGTACVANGGGAPLNLYVAKVYNYSFSGPPLFKNLYDQTDASANPRCTDGQSPEPSRATGLTISSPTQTSLTLSCTPGSGTGRMFIIYDGPLIPENSTNGWDGIDYGPGNTGYGIDAVSGVGYVISSTAATSTTVTGLTPGANWYVGVIEYYDTPGLARNYNTNLVIPANYTSHPTIPADPTVNAATNISSNVFNINWNSAFGANNYYIDVSDDNYSTYLINNLAVGNVNTYQVTGLTGNKQYYYRVRSYNNAGTSASTAKTQTTAPAPPAVNTASAVNNTSFNINWTASTGATGYFLDVSTANNFSAPVGSYTNVSVGNVTTYAINTGLSANTTYYYRLRATSAIGTSVNSATGSTTTAPAVPTLSSSAVLNNSFSANWNASAGAINYFLDVSTASNFSSFVSGYNNLAAGNVTSTTVTGLSANTQYYFRVRAASGTGTSVSSTNANVTTGPPPPTASAPTGMTINSFSVNWTTSASATKYLIDVSTANNFSAFVTNYNNRDVSNVTTFVVNENLSPNTTYYVRVRATNANGSSVNSNVVNTLTVAGPPTTIAATAVSQTGFTANWNAVAGVTDFKLDVSTDNFATFVAGFNNLTVTGTSKVVPSLSPGSTYQYRVRAINASGTSTSSNTTSALTVPQNPVAAAATNVLTTGFTIGWADVPGATSYLLDLSDKNDFSTFVTGYSAKTINGTSETVTGLAVGSTWYYRLKASNSSGNSGFSNIITQWTKPNAPVTNAVGSKGANSFTASWKPVPNVTEYELDVAVFDPQNTFSSLVPGYNAKKITFTPASAEENAEELVIGLTSGTYYSFRVRATNPGGASANSAVKSMQTDGGGKTFNVSVSTPDKSLFSESGTAITGKASDGLGSISGEVIYKGITAGAGTEQTKSFTSTDTNFSVPVTTDMLDELGLEYTVKVKDQTDTELQSTTRRIYRQFVSKQIENLESGFNGDPSGYRMFSIPAELSSNRIEDIFQALTSQFGGYDKTKWKLLRYNKTKDGYDEYEAGLTTIEPGKSYWFNARVNPNPVLISGSVAKVSADAPFQLVLDAGWNQIGNPYPFNLDWSKMQTTNAAAGLNKLWAFESNNYTQKSTLIAWKGGFVFSDHGGTVTFPLSAKTTNTSRELEKQANDEINWQIDLQLSLNGLNHSGAVGMNINASPSKDRFDEILRPRLVDYLEMFTVHKEFFAHNFAADVVPPSSRHDWTFNFDSNQNNGEATVSWNKELVAELPGEMLLVDLDEEKWISMSGNKTYSFRWKIGKNIRIVYSKDGPADAGVSLMGHAYPNPFDGTMNIPLLLQNGDTYAQVQVYDMLGRRIRTLSQQFERTGSQLLNWDGLDENGINVPPGMYVYRMSTTNGRSQSRVVTKTSSR